MNTELIKRWRDHACAFCNYDTTELTDALQTADAKVAKLEAGNSEMRYVLGMVSCEFEEGSWQRRDIDAAIKEDT
jgi:hypothetical protein